MGALDGQRGLGWLRFPQSADAQAIRGSSPPPYFEWTGLQCDESPDEVTSIGFIARENRDKMREIGGHPSEAWLEVMEDDERIGELFNSMVAPRLVVVDYKLHLLVLRDGRPHPFPHHRPEGLAGPRLLGVGAARLARCRETELRLLVLEQREGVLAPSARQCSRPRC
ncbi:MAG: hypothetical protein Ct9H300mP10_00490 [Methanobacteriota archaeon]|nr:MAG: hypothetical protein Ct9H300mP10_00490 [Euryarchaeota archaeon]